MANLQRFIKFKGELSSDGRNWPMAFRVRIVASGEVELDLPSLRGDSSTWDIHSLWREARQAGERISLRGSSRDGIGFESDSLRFTRMGTRTDDTGDWLELAACCAAARFTSAREPDGIAVVRQKLRGFESRGILQTHSPLGTVTLAGMTRLPKGDQLSGYILVVADATPPDPSAWRQSVDKLLDHIRQILSFAASRHLKAPITEAWLGAEWSIQAYSQTNPRARGLQVFHPLNLGPIFEAAVASHFDPPIAVQNLTYALEWFTMEAGYTEVRLVNAMTALENLADSNLSAEDQRLLPPKMFEKIARAMRRAAEADAGSEHTSAFLERLPAKMLELNRRPLRDKIMLLAAKWNVPLGDLTPGPWERAIKARNLIVHRGRYYEEIAPPPEQRDLWDHVLLVREILVRIVLKAIGFDGQYLSFRGGQHFETFPPERP